MKIDGVKFKRKIIPGDTLQFELHLTEPIRRGVCVMDAKAFVGDTLACRGDADGAGGQNEEIAGAARDRPPSVYRRGRRSRKTILHD